MGGTILKLDPEGVGSTSRGGCPDVRGAERGGVDTEGRGLRPKLNLGAGPREAGGVLPVISGASAQPQVLLKGL